MQKLNTEKYKKKLLEERERLHAEMEVVEQDISYDDTGAGQSELADYDQHPADAATETFEKERDLSLRDSFRDTIGRIDEALGKIDRGTFGLCDRCGREIPARRLDAVPHAIYCVECQDTVEGS
jgi:RNA polymerase-binding protein DksA